MAFAVSLHDNSLICTLTICAIFLMCVTVLIKNKSLSKKLDDWRPLTFGESGLAVFCAGHSASGTGQDSECKGLWMMTLSVLGFGRYFWARKEYFQSSLKPEIYSKNHKSLSLGITFSILFHSQIPTYPWQRPSRMPTNPWVPYPHPSDGPVMAVGILENYLPSSAFFPWLSARSTQGPPPLQADPFL